MGLVKHRIIHRPAPSASEKTRFVRLAPDGQRIAYLTTSAACRTTLCTRWAETGRTDTIADFGAEEIDGLEWSGDGQHLAYVIRGSFPVTSSYSVGICAAQGDEIARTAGGAFVWSPRRTALALVDVGKAALIYWDPSAQTRTKLAEFFDDGDPDLGPRLAFSGDGRRLAATARNPRDGSCQVWVISRDSGNIQSQLLTKLPGLELCTVPFWSPGGRSLGLWVVDLHRQHTRLLVFRQLRSQPETLFESEHLCPAQAPAWSPDGALLAHLEPAAAGTNLAIRHSRNGERIEAFEVGSGRPRFLSDQEIALDGGGHAEVIQLDPIESPSGGAKS